MRLTQHITLVIPARNEAAALPDILSQIPNWVDRTIVVDNASSDMTSAIATAAGAIALFEKRVGYGAACSAGLNLASQLQTDIVVFMDADGSDDPKEIHRLVEPILENLAEMVIGRRSPTASMPIHQRIGTRLVCNILSVGFGTAVQDIGPFRAASADALSRLPLTDRGFGWTAEMQAQALRIGVRMRETDVSWHPGKSKSEISGTLSGVARAARDLLRHSIREIFFFRLEKLQAWAPIARARKLRG